MHQEQEPSLLLKHGWHRLSYPLREARFCLGPRSSIGRVYNSSFEIWQSFQAFFEGTAEDPILVPGEDDISTRTGFQRRSQSLHGGFSMDLPCPRASDLGPADTDEDYVIVGRESFQTPPRMRTPCNPASVRLLGAAIQRPGICRFTIQDFTPRAECPNPYLRQSLGEYLPWLHNCGEATCPFTEPPTHVRRQSLEIGHPLPNSGLSPGDHVRVDKRAFLHDVHVKVTLELLGYDRGMWGGLEHFSGHVVDSYYHEVTGFPMFTMDFMGSIGKREVKVCDAILDSAKTFGGSTQRFLDFGSPSVGEIIMPSAPVT
jgi:hypothetical protein